MSDLRTVYVLLFHDRHTGPEVTVYETEDLAVDSLNMFLDDREIDESRVTAHKIEGDILYNITWSEEDDYAQIHQAKVYE